MDLHGGFPVPAEPGVAREVPLQHRPGIHVESLGAAEGLQFPVELPQPLFYQVVIVVIPRVAGDPVASVVPFGKRTTARIVIQRETDDRPATGQHLARIAASLRRALKPRHFAMFSFRDPIAEKIRVTRLLRPCDPTIVETQLRSPRLDLPVHPAHKWPVKK